jgi:hypothetical protein
MFRRRIAYIWIITVSLVGGAVWAFSGLYILLGLIALSVLFAVFVHIARRCGWGGWGRMDRYLNRQPFEDETRRSKIGDR